MQLFECKCNWAQICANLTSRSAKALATVPSPLHHWTSTFASLHSAPPLHRAARSRESKRKEKPVHVKYFSTSSLKSDHKCLYNELTHLNTRIRKRCSNTMNMSQEHKKFLFDFLSCLSVYQRVNQAGLWPLLLLFVPLLLTSSRPKTFPLKWKRHNILLGKDKSEFSNLFMANMIKDWFFICCQPHHCASPFWGELDNSWMQRFHFPPGRVCLSLNSVWLNKWMSTQDWIKSK